MKPILIFLIVFTCKFVFSAQITQALIKHADTTPVNIRKNHLLLSKYLAAPCESPQEKVLVFSYWIAKNIRYDLKEVKTNKRNKIAREVLENRKAVCGGFSALFAQLCKNEQIQCYYITGYAYGHFLKKLFAEKSLAHAWNIVYLNNEWKLIDVTWCIDLVRTSEFKKNRELKWIFMDPKEFAETHLPDDPRWQLLEDPNTVKEFWKQRELSERTYNLTDSLQILVN